MKTNNNSPNNENISKSIDSKADVLEDNMLEQIVAGRIKPERRNFRKILFLLISALLVISVFLWWNFIRSVPLRISKETTFLTEPLRQDGKGIDYLGYLKSKQPKEMATDENGIRILARSICCRTDYKKELNGPLQKMFESSCGELGLKPEDLKPLPGENFYSAWKKELEKKYPGAENKKLREGKYRKIEGKWFDGPWTKEQEEFSRNWIRDNASALDKMVEAANKKIFIAPILTEIDGGGHSAFMEPVFSSEIFFHWRAIARALVFRACVRMRLGDLAGAASDKRAVLNLGQGVKNSLPNTLCVFLLGVAIEGMGMKIPLVTETNREIPESDLRSIIDLVRTEDDFQYLDKCLYTEKLMCLDYIQKLSNDKLTLKEYYKKSNASVFMVRLDWNVVAKTLNEIYDAPEKIAKDSSAKEIWLGSREEYSKKFVHSLISLNEVYNGVLDIIDRTRCDKNLQAISMAILLYEKKNGKSLPVFSKDNRGKPLHSWRVLILPWLGSEERKLYEKIRLDEPWDSDYNRRFHQCNLPIFRCPSAERWQEKRFKLYENKRENMTLTVPRPGDATYSMLSDSGIIVERPDPICWMRPDAEITPENARKGINGIASNSSQKEVKLQAGQCGSFHNGGMNTALPDGSAAFRAEGYSFP